MDAWADGAANVRSSLSPPPLITPDQDWTVEAEEEKVIRNSKTLLLLCLLNKFETQTHSQPASQSSEQKRILIINIPTRAVRR